MKPPTKSFRYDDNEWREIKKVLASTGADADTVTVRQCHSNIPHPLRGMFKLLRRGKKQYPLRDELECLAQEYQDEMQQTRTPTAHDLVSKVAAITKEIAVVRERFAPYQWPGAYLIDNKNAALIYQLLTAAAAELHAGAKRELAGSELRFGKRGDNASKPELRDYQLRLAAVWDELAGESSTVRQRNSFVLACTGPVAKVSKKSVAEFLRRETSKTTI